MHDTDLVLHIVFQVTNPSEQIKALFSIPIFLGEINDPLRSDVPRIGTVQKAFACLGTKQRTLIARLEH